MQYWKKNLYVLWGTQFLAMVGVNLIVPFLPFYIRQLGVTNDQELARWSGLIFAAPFLTAFVAAPLWGTLGDRYGRKLMVVRAIFGLGLSQILIGMAGDVYQLLAFRLLQGLISGYIAASLALVSISTPTEKIGYALGLLQTATAGGTVLGPAIGGILADFMSYHDIFFIIAGLCCLGGILIIRLVREEVQAAPEGTQPTVMENIRYVATNRKLRTIGVLILLAQAGALMIEPIFALFIEQFKTPTRYLSTLVGIIFSIAGVFMVISAPWWGNRNDRIGYRKNLAIAASGTGIAYAAHMIVPGLVSLGFLRAGLGFFRGGILHSLFSLTSRHVPPGRRGGIIGIASSLAILGNSLGPLAGGFIAEHFGIVSVFSVNSLIFLLIASIAWNSDIDRGIPAPAAPAPPPPPIARDADGPA
ncbi:MAG TPA: MFS transporter [Bacteroidota bacterium]|nr:MFS transporter [Bacteroidota bacterium]